LVNDKEHGFVLLPNLGGERFDSVRTLAFGKWIEALRNHCPDEDIPWGDRIVFPQNCVMTDHRRQVILRNGIPDEINEEDLTSYVAWLIYRVINDLQVVEEFTQYIPKRYTDVNTKRMISAGKWPCEKNTKPIHLLIKF
jgi:hypothetical protein